MAMSEVMSLTLSQAALLTGNESEASGTGTISAGEHYAFLARSAELKAQRKIENKHRAEAAKQKYCAGPGVVPW